MKFCFALIAALALPIGCGDNSDECGPGTHAVDGVCTPDNGSGTTTCSNGTKLDTTTGTCVVDPNDCQDGTVLVGTQCVDPGHVTADLEEGPEPNGLGIFGEDSNAPAGAITLKPVGEHFVIHGTIAPFRDTDGDGQKDADLDTYLLSVSGPTLVHITADGLHGLAAGFGAVAAVAANDPLATWERLGVNLTGDTSKRDLYLPEAGDYAIVIADTRTLFLTGGAAGAADGADAFEYYVTVDQTTPTVTALTATSGDASSSGMIAPGEVKFFSVPMGAGIATVTYDADAPQFTESAVVVNTRGSTSTVKVVANGDPTQAAPADAAVATAIGFKTGDSTIVVADNVFNYALDPTAYTLDVKLGDAGALSASGGNITQSANPTDFSVFYYDVATGNEITGMNIAFDTPVEAVVVDESFNIFAKFSFDPAAGYSGAFDTYAGLLRERKAGRYYFLTFDDTGTATSITATSTVTALTPVAVTEGTTTASQTVNAFTSNPFTYVRGTTDGWQQFAATTTGDATGQFFDPTTAYGRLDFVNTGCGPDCDDTEPMFAGDISTAPAGRIVLDDPTAYLLDVQSTAAFTLSFTRRDHTVIGPLTTGAAATATAGTLTGAATERRYLIEGTGGDKLDVSLAPALFDGVLTYLDKSEGTISAVDAAGLGGTEDLKTLLSKNGWTAVSVSSNLPIATTASFTLTTGVTAGAHYAKTSTTTAFDDACTGGTAVALAGGADTGTSAAIAVPTAFTFYGYAVANMRVNANGFLTFDTPTCTGSCTDLNQDMPSTAAPNSVIAPYWADLDTSVCTKTSGTKLIIQWSGFDFNTFGSDAFQVILDGSNDSIEIVYSDNQQDFGADASIGLESQFGVYADKVSFDTNSITAGSAFKYTPM